MLQWLCCPELCCAVLSACLHMNQVMLLLLWPLVSNLSSDFMSMLLMLDITGKIITLGNAR